MSSVIVMKWLFAALRLEEKKLRIKARKCIVIKANSILHEIVLQTVITASRLLEISDLDELLIKELCVGSWPA